MKSLQCGAPSCCKLVYKPHYSYKYHKPIVLGVINQLSYLRGPTLYRCVSFRASLAVHFRGVRGMICEGHRGTDERHRERLPHGRPTGVRTPRCEDLNWLAVWNMNFIFPNSWDDDPIWIIFFRGLKPSISEPVRQNFQPRKWRISKAWNWLVVFKRCFLSKGLNHEIAIHCPGLSHA